MLSWSLNMGSLPIQGFRNHSLEIINYESLFILSITYYNIFCIVTGATQLLMTTCLGFVQMYLPFGMYKLVDREGKPPNFLRNMILVGTMR